jgi:hypothetical protein
MSATCGRCSRAWILARCSRQIQARRTAPLHMRYLQLAMQCYYTHPGAAVAEEGLACLLLG